IMRHTGEDITKTLERLANEGGLLGISGRSSDIRDIESAAADGDADCQLALDVYVEEVRRHLGGMIVALGGVDVISFTGGIGENGCVLRLRILSGLNDLGIVVDDDINKSLRDEGAFHAPQSRVALWVVPTNEELVVARQTVAAVAPSA
ncbi:MAG: acetate/propionate family kinase, partial [Planctomycetota bacterium]